jgi:hypothetical protein
MHVDSLNERCRLPDGDEAEARPAPFEGHIKLGSPQQPVSIQEIKNSHGQRDHAFQGFRCKFSEFINTSLPAYGYHLERWISISANF